MGFGSKNMIKYLEKQMHTSEEEKQMIEDTFEKESICSANGTYCLKGCKYKEGGTCQRMLNKQKKNG